ncbi:hypothetical protein E4G67_01310 [Candidatus Bathyarchaeota archaeon]|nr:MAG: hypothetical protein E4G67_01310 [Candidatus Bathyarchaeota archaeon]
MVFAKYIHKDSVMNCEGVGVSIKQRTILCLSIAVLIAVYFLSGKIAPADACYGPHITADINKTQIKLNESVTRNYIANNQRGLFFGFNNKGDIIPSDIVINHNDFENNIVQLNGCECKDYNITEPPQSWDDGRQGNFWSDYNGTDSNNDVGDTRYVIDVLNQDRYPLMQSPVKLPVPATKIPIEIIVLGISAFIVIVVVLLVYSLRKKT